MRAAVIFGAHSVRVDDVDDPVLPGPSGAVVTGQQVRHLRQRLALLRR